MIEVSSRPQVNFGFPTSRGRGRGAGLEAVARNLDDLEADFFRLAVGAGKDDAARQRTEKRSCRRISTPSSWVVRAAGRHGSPPGRRSNGEAFSRSLREAKTRALVEEVIQQFRCQHRSLVV